jgi:hypothetical protein
VVGRGEGADEAVEEVLLAEREDLKKPIAS